MAKPGIVFFTAAAAALAVRNIGVKCERITQARRGDITIEIMRCYPTCKCKLDAQSLLLSSAYTEKETNLQRRFCE